MPHDVILQPSTVANEAVTEKLQFWFSAITLKFTWMFHGSRALLFFFVLYITYRYGHIRLGGKNDKPVFSSLSYFCMIFAADAGPRFLSYQVTEPMIHRYGNHFANAGYHSQDEIDMFAMNMTVVHWGVVSWTHYTLVAIAMALAGQRFKLPMTFRSCFYPILGDYTWGWMGDFVDSLAIVVTMACLATMLSITALQSIAGLTYMGFIDSENTSSEQAAMQNAIVWVITLVSTASVISGLQGGIQYMSIIAMSLGFFLAFLIYVMDDTKYLLNLQVQEVGYYLQNSIFQLNFWTDAFGQLREGSGRAVDGQAANQNWIESWTMFYQSWV